MQGLIMNNYSISVLQSLLITITLIAVFFTQDTL